MDIIIRNQDKTAVAKVNFLSFGDEWEYEKRTRHAINFVVCDNGVKLGKYATKERCIEIINDIYNEVIRRATDGDSVVIYSMPKE